MLGRQNVTSNPAVRELNTLWYALVRQVAAAQAAATPPPF